MIKAINVEHCIDTKGGSDVPTLRILHNINLEIAAGERVAIVGASGSGKSTLLSMLAGLDKPTSGHILLAGDDITAMSEEERTAVRRQHMAFVFQNFQLLPALTALENVALPLEIKNDADVLKKAEQYLTHVGLAKRYHHYPSELSGGEQQRVALARAFACEAPIIFADEPTGNLDSKTGEVITDLLFELNEKYNTTLVLVTHSKELASRCQRQLHMASGELSELNVLTTENAGNTAT